MTYVKVNYISATQGDTAVCINANDELSECSPNASEVTLQQAYEAGNTIETLTNRDIAFTLEDTAIDSKFIITNEGTATAFIINDTNAGTNSLLELQSERHHQLCRKRTW